MRSQNKKCRDLKNFDSEECILHKGYRKVLTFFPFYLPPLSRLYTLHLVLFFLSICWPFVSELRSTKGALQKSQKESQPLSIPVDYCQPLSSFFCHPLTNHQQLYPRASWSPETGHQGWSKRLNWAWWCHSSHSLRELWRPVSRLRPWLSAAVQADTESHPTQEIKMDGQNLCFILAWWGSLLQVRWRRIGASTSWF